MPNTKQQKLKTKKKKHDKKKLNKDKNSQYYTEPYQSLRQSWPLFIGFSFFYSHPSPSPLRTLKQLRKY